MDPMSIITRRTKEKRKSSQSRGTERKGRREQRRGRTDTMTNRSSRLSSSSRASGRRARRKPSARSKSAHSFAMHEIGLRVQDKSKLMIVCKSVCCCFMKQCREMGERKTKRERARQQLPVSLTALARRWRMILAADSLLRGWMAIGWRA